MTTDYTKNFQLSLPDFRMGPWHDLVNGDFEQIDALLYGILSGAEVNVWTNNTAYIAGISVMDSVDASIWMCAIANTSAATGTFAAERATHPTYWIRLLTGFAPRGAWQHNTQYFPYDLAYQSSLGIFALCEQKHTSNPSGTIKDDSAYWVWLCDLSSANIATAAAVTYTNAVSPALTAKNVQDAIDQLEAQILSLNNVNVTQGTDIASLRTDLTALATKEASDITAVTNASMHIAGNQLTTGGFRYTSFNMGNGSGTVVPDPMKGNYQYIANVGAFVIAVPVNDCAIEILITNGAGASSVSFSGYTVSANTGDLITATVGSKFLVAIRRINNVSTFVVKALQ